MQDADITFSAQGAFPGQPSSGILKIDRLENQII